jgi:hypothetical protein
MAASDVPSGGTTAALDPAERAALIEHAARWLFDHPGHQRPTLAALADKFGLSTRDGIEAIRQSRQLWSEAIREAAQHEEK